MAEFPSIPASRVLGLTPEFSNDPQKMAQWQAFVGREPLLLNPGDLVAAIRPPISIQREYRLTPRVQPNIRVAPVGCLTLARPQAT